MANNPWSIAATGWAVIVIGWLLVPIFSFLVNKLFAYLVFDESKELRELEFVTVPALQATLRVVEEKRMTGAARDDICRNDLEKLNKIHEDLKSALCEAEDILDLADYHRIEKEVTGEDRISWVHRLIRAAGASIVSLSRWTWASVLHLVNAAGDCILRCLGSLIQRCIDITPAPLQQCLHSTKQQLGRLFGGIVSLWRPVAGCASSLLPVSQATSIAGVRRFCGWSRTLTASIACCCHAVLSWCHPYSVRILSFCSWIFVQLQNFCRWSRKHIANITSFCGYIRDWSYEQVGIKSNQQEDGSAGESLVPITERISMRNQIKRIKDILTTSKNSLDVLNDKNSNSCKDAHKESSSFTVKNSAEGSTSSQKEIDDVYRSIEKKVFGRDKDRDHIIRMLREGADTYAASSSTSKPYSVIGIYGITGSGKSTLAQYVCDYEKGARHFNLIMFILVGKSFSVCDIFREMLDQIKQQQASNTEDPKSLKTELKDLKSLKAELEKELKGKCFLLVLDDLWVNADNKKEREEREIQLDVLRVAQSGSRILVTAQKKDAAAALGAQEQIPIPDLEDGQYLSMFMHYSLQVSQVTSTDYGRYEAIGRKITKKLRGSSIAARTVAARLKSNNSIGFWETTANLDVLNETMGALWWSYQQLGADIRRCFAYFSIFPKAYILEREKLIGMWIAQGYVNTTNSTEELEDIGQSYFDQLVTFSFVQVKKKISGSWLHELAERVSGSEFFRIGFNGSPKNIPRGVLHVFIETNSVAEIAEKIVDMENLRTLIIKEPYAGSVKTVEKNHDIEKLLVRLFMRPMKLRVLITELNHRTKQLSVPASIGQMKHLRYIGFHFHDGLFNDFDLILPSTFSKLYHIQIIDIPYFRASCPEDMANLICLRHTSALLSFPNIGRLTSLQTLRMFEVKEGQGYGLKQLKHLNKLRGTLWIQGLEIVGSKEEARETQLTHKERLSRLVLDFGWDMRRFGPDVEAAVVEGLCPPKDLQELQIYHYRGSRYPSWMLSRHHSEIAPKQLQRLVLCVCSQLASIPEDSELFIGLGELIIFKCDWDSLPEKMERLVSLQTLEIWFCHNMELLPKLPVQSLKKIIINGCSVLSTTCKEEGHENWRKIQQIREKKIE